MNRLEHQGSIERRNCKDNKEEDKGEKRNNLWEEALGPHVRSGLKDRVAFFSSSYSRR